MKSKDMKVKLVFSIEELGTLSRAVGELAAYLERLDDTKYKKTLKIMNKIDEALDEALASA